MSVVTDNCIVVENALIDLELSVLRDKRTDRRTFKRAAKRIASLLAAEVGKHEIKLVSTSIETPLVSTTGCIPLDKIVVATVLRAALALEDKFDDVLRASKVVHIGLCRDEQTARAGRYYPPEGKPLSDIQGMLAVLIDPMLATGGSAVAALDILKKGKPKKMVMGSIVVAPEGLEAVKRWHPDVMIYTCAKDKCLDDRKFILPGLGDFGDRLYGTT